MTWGSQNFQELACMSNISMSRHRARIPSMIKQALGVIPATQNRSQLKHQYPKVWTKKLELITSNMQVYFMGKRPGGPVTLIDAMQACCARPYSRVPPVAVMQMMSSS